MTPNPPPERVPTLTEVVQWPERASDAAAPALPTPAWPAQAAPALPRPAAATFSMRRSDPGASVPLTAALPSGPGAGMPLPLRPSAPADGPAIAPVAVSPALPEAAAGTSADDLIQQVYVDLQRQVELMLEYRLRETLAPMLTRAADSIVREARTELASTLRDVVARAVAQEMSRHRTR